jgi:DNA-binding SARP family transcriptional activator
VEFRILGPLEVLDGDRVLRLGAGHQRMVLALLLLRANEAIPRDRLIHELWGDRPPKTAAKALQGHVSALRRQLEPGGAAAASRMILTRAGGYELRIEPEQLDLGKVERLRDEGRLALEHGESEKAAEKLREALALWRGQPLADFLYESFAQAEIARLEELRLATLEDRLEADLARGRHPELIGELEALVQAHPGRERLRGQLMLALYRSGRQAEALDAYRAARTALADELGIEPSRALRDLQRAILRQDPAIDFASAPQPDRVRGGVFVGRESELAELNAALDDAVTGRGRLALLVGEPGIGKSRLADELLGRARGRGAQVLVGRAWEAGGAPAYWPWVQSLRGYLRVAEAEIVREQLGLAAPDLAQLLPELRELFPDLPHSVALESEWARFRLFEATSSFLLAAARGRPLVLVLDDLHAADEPSLLLLRFVAREIAAGRVLLVCALRDVDPVLRDPLSSTVAELLREPHTLRIALSGLKESEVAEYIRATTGIEPAAGLVHAIHSEADGNPLFVGEIVRLLDSEARLAEPDGHVTIPPEVRAVIGRRVGRLSAECLSMLVAASVLGREFRVDALAQLTGLSPDRVLDVLDEPMTERVLEEVPGVRGRLRFAHALIRDTLYEDLTPARRMKLHKEAGDALEVLYSADPEPHLSELALHFVAAAPAGVEDKAVEYARRAGDRAAGQLASEEAARLFEMALSLAGDPTERCELFLALGDAQARAGSTAASKQSFLRAAELAEALGLVDHLVKAAIGYGGRIIYEVSRDDEAWVPLLESALAALGPDDSLSRVRLLARLAALREAGFVAERKAALGREAVEMARRLGDPATLAYALSAYIPANESPRNVLEMLQLASELLDLSIDVGDQERAVEAYEHRLGRLIELGEMQAARADLDAMRKITDELRQPAQRWLVGACEARDALLAGRLDEAERLIRRALGFGQRAHPAIAENTFRLQLYLLRREQGRLLEIEDIVRRADTEYPANRVWRCVLAQTTAELGLNAESKRTLDGLAADRFAALPFREMWLVSMCFLAEAASELDESEHASLLYELLLPYADRIGVSYPEISTGSMARYLGLLAATERRYDVAVRHFQEALRVNEGIGAQSWVAHTQADYGCVALARDSRGDRARAKSLLEAAVATFRQLGMASHAARTTAVRKRIETRTD